VFSAMQFLLYVPSTMFATVEYNQVFSDFSLFPVFIYQIIFILFVLVGYSGKPLENKENVESALKQSTHRKIPGFPLILSLYFVGILAKVYTIYISGGIVAILRNPALSYLNLTSGYGFFEILKYFVYTSIIFIIYRISLTKSKIEIFIAFLMIATYVFFDLVFSRRSITITFAIILVFSVNYFYKRIKLRYFFTPKLLILSIIIAIIIVVMPIIRSGNFMEYGQSIGEMNLVSSINSIFSRLSMVGRDIFVYSHFGLSNFWLGKSYLNLPTAFIPSSIWIYKPAVDEGVYLANLIYGFIVSPNESFVNLRYKTSIPFTTQGLLYANFGFFGTILGGILMGYIYKLSYYKIQIKKANIANIMIYRVIIFEFGLTVMTLTDSIIQIIIILFAYFIYTINFKHNKYISKMTKSLL
jgi:oligosaccharide repeat unit polymerase